jgi:two-component system KDP operon response regulator KdpE
MNNCRILIVDDEPKLVHLVREILQATGYDVLAASSGDQAIEMVALEQPDLVILDIILLGSLDGYETARRIREFSNVPIVMLTARVREAEKLKGFEVGVDDYVTKPFSSKELLARIRAVLKRCKEAAPTTPLETKIAYGDLNIDLLRRSVTIGDREVHLTPTEYNLLHEMALHCNQVLLHEQLLTAVWGPEYRDDIDYLRAYIHYLRKKLEPNPTEPRLILSCPGVGYMLYISEQDS